jgi:hypothetical protein
MAIPRPGHFCANTRSSSAASICFDIRVMSSTICPLTREIWKPCSPSLHRGRGIHLGDREMESLFGCVAARRRSSDPILTGSTFGRSSVSRWLGPWIRALATTVRSRMVRSSGQNSWYEVAAASRSRLMTSTVGTGSGYFDCDMIRTEPVSAKIQLSNSLSIARAVRPG